MTMPMMDIGHVVMLMLQCGMFMPMRVDSPGRVMVVHIIMFMAVFME